jgi:hypothetical protein
MANLPTYTNELRHSLLEAYLNDIDQVIHAKRTYSVPSAQRTGTETQKQTYDERTRRCLLSGNFRVLDNGFVQCIF